MFHYGQLLSRPRPEARCFLNTQQMIESCCDKLLEHSNRFHLIVTGRPNIRVKPSGGELIFIRLNDN